MIYFHNYLYFLQNNKQIQLMCLTQIQDLMQKAKVNRRRNSPNNRKYKNNLKNNNKSNDEIICLIKKFRYLFHKRVRK